MCRSQKTWLVQWVDRLSVVASVLVSVFEHDFNAVLCPLTSSTHVWIRLYCVQASKLKGVDQIMRLGKFSLVTLVLHPATPG